MRPTAIAATLLFATALACDRNTTPWVPIDQEPPPPAKPVQIPGLEMAQAPPEGAMQARSAARGESAELAEGPSSAPSAAPTAEAPSGEGLSGTLRIADGSAIPSGGVLFLIARTGPPPQPPLAVKRLPLGPFPFEFSIGPSDVMIPGRKFAGAITLTARIDQDGDPMSRGAEDLQGAALEAVQPGTTGIEIVLAAGTR